MGADEDKNVKKPAVSNAVRKKKPTGRQTSEEKKAGSPDTSKTGATKSGSAVRNSAGKSESAARSSAGKSGSAVRNSAGKSGSAARSSAGKSESAARSNTEKNKAAAANRRKRKGMTWNQFVLILSAVIGIVLVVIISAIMRNKYLKVEQVESEYALGSTFDIKNYVEPVNDNAIVTLDGDEFEPDEIGTFEVEYVVKCGKLKAHKKVTIEVVDRDFPDIVGPDTLGVFVGEDVDLLDYYSVEDAQPDLSEELKISAEIDTSETGHTEYTLRVTDWSNNSSTKTIELVVCAYEGEKKTAAYAVREYNRVNGTAVKDNYVYVYEDEDTGSEYVLINDSQVYEVTEDGCSQADAEDELIQIIRNNSLSVKTDTLSYFNYNL